MRKLKNPYKSLYKARNNFLASQPEYKTNKFGVIKVGRQKLKYGLSKSEDAWLDRLYIPYRSVPIYGFPLPNSNKRKVYIVDGYDPNTNTIYEFLGDRWHGSPMLYNLDKYDPQLKKTYRQLYYETISRFQIFHDLGYKIFFVWENKWKKGDLGRLYRNRQDNLL